jgi:hypothetical protein
VVVGDGRVVDVTGAELVAVVLGPVVLEAAVVVVTTRLVVVVDDLSTASASSSPPPQAEATRATPSAATRNLME